MGSFNGFHVELDAQVWFFRQRNLAVNDLPRVFGRMLCVLPDPLGINCRDLAKCDRRNMCKHGKRHIKVVVEMRARGQAQLDHLNRALHGPKVQVG